MNSPRLPLELEVLNTSLEIIAVVSIEIAALLLLYYSIPRLDTSEQLVFGIVLPHRLAWRELFFHLL